MKYTGMVKKIDELGRLVIPYEIRRSLGIDRESVEFFLDEDRIIIKKWAAHCIFCGGTEELIEHKGKLICCSCKNELTDK